MNTGEDSQKTGSNAQCNINGAINAPSLINGVILMKEDADHRRKLLPSVNID